MIPMSIPFNLKALTCSRRTTDSSGVHTSARKRKETETEGAASRIISLRSNIIVVHIHTLLSSILCMVFLFENSINNGKRLKRKYLLGSPTILLRAQPFVDVIYHLSTETKRISKMRLLIRRPPSGPIFV